MAGSRTGTPTIWNYAVKITRLKGKLGGGDMTDKLNSEFTACVDALITCTLALLATDDYVLKVDRTAPLGPEDTGP